MWGKGLLPGKGTRGAERKVFISMTQSRKRGWKGQTLRGRRWALIPVVLLLLVLVPYAWHLNKLALAARDYQLEQAKIELAWFNTYGGFLKQLPAIRDQALWIRLVQGEEQSAGGSLEQLLSQYHDDQHRFWLLLWEVKQGDLKRAEQDLTGLTNSPQKALGEGLVALAAGEVDRARKALATGSHGLSRGEQALWHLAWVQVAMNDGDREKSKAELAAAAKLGPENPAYLDMAFAEALWARNWAEAKSISQRIDAETWRPVNRVYLVTRGLLAVQLQDFAEVQAVLGKLQGLSGSGKYMDYIQGVFSLSQGDTAIGRARLQKALQAGLDGHFKEDATKALSQLEERLGAEKALKVLD